MSRRAAHALAQRDLKRTVETENVNLCWLRDQDHLREQGYCFLWSLMLPLISAWTYQMLPNCNWIFYNVSVAQDSYFAPQLVFCLASLPRSSSMPLSAVPYIFVWFHGFVNCTLFSMQSLGSKQFLASLCSLNSLGATLILLLEYLSA